LNTTAGVITFLILYFFHFLIFDIFLCKGTKKNGLFQKIRRNFARVHV